jgi:hypothetical protein
MKEDIMGLGPTDAEILHCLSICRMGRLPFDRFTRRKIDVYRLIAYTTILTTSPRLEEKGLITRHTTGAAYNGAPADTGC